MKPFKLIVLTCISLISFFEMDKIASAKTVGVIECSLPDPATQKREIRQIFSAHMKFSAKGYAIEIQEENGNQIFGLTKNLNYYYDSSNFYYLKGTPAGLIALDGSFVLKLPYTPRKGCTYKGYLSFDSGVKESLFKQDSYLESRNCQNSLTKSKIRFEYQNISVSILEKEKSEYNNPFAEQAYRYIFALSGFGVDSLSDAFLTELSEGVFQNCLHVREITFEDTITKMGRDFRVFENQKVKRVK